MADKVIIAGVTRGREQVSIQEIKQAIGRSGRSQTGITGYADIVIGESEIDEFKNDFDSDRLVVKSSINEIDKIAFHIIADINNGSVKNIEDARSWYAKSLSASQGNRIDFDKVFQHLEEHRAIVIGKSSIAITQLGKMSAQFYFDPIDVFAWKRNFEMIFSRGLEEDEVAIAWALADAPSQKKYWVNMKKAHYPMDECKCRMGSIDLDVTYSNATAVLVWLCALGGASFGGSASLVRIVQSDCNRIHQVLKLMNVHEDWQMDKFFDDMKVRTKYGIPQDLVDLCKIPGLGKNYAIQLYNKGIESLSDMQERLDEVEDLGGLKLKNMIRKELSEISRESC